MEWKKHVFTPMEKKIFVHVIKKYQDVLDNKKTDNATARLKNETWEKIASEFNANLHTHTEASPKQLRRLWMNLKQRQKEVVSKLREYEPIIASGPSTAANVAQSRREAITQSHEYKPVVENGSSTSTPEVELETPPHLSPNFKVNKTDKEGLKMSKIIHDLEVELLKEKIREARAKADLAELILEHEQHKRLRGTADDPLISTMSSSITIKEESE